MSPTPVAGPDATLVAVEEIQSYLPLVRAGIDDAVESLPGSELQPIIGSLTGALPGPLSLLPLASCGAVGGHPPDAVPVAAAWEILNLAIRVLDDLQDKDRLEALWQAVGEARAFNFAAALYTLAHSVLTAAPWSSDRYRAVTRMLLDDALGLVEGQDRDLAGAHTGQDAYWQVMEGKNARAFAFACGAGAMIGTVDRALVAALRRFGHHLGLALQLFDDLEGIWGENDGGDLALGKVTLPVLYAMDVVHPGRDELVSLVRGGRLGPDVDAARVRALLDGAGTREFVLLAALKEQERAVHSLGPCSWNAGRLALEGYVTALFARLEELLPDEEAGPH